MAGRPSKPSAEKKLNERLMPLAKAGDMEAREAILTANDRLCYYLAGKFQNTGYSLEDLVSIARIGMIKGYETFKIEKGFLFATYVSRCITNEILMQLRKDKKHKRLGIISLDTILTKDEIGNELTFMDIVSAPDDTQEKEEKNYLHYILEEFKKTCSERDWQVIDFIYFQNKKQRDVANILNISQSYISRLEKKILFKIKRLYNKNMNDSSVNNHSTVQKKKGDDLEMAKHNQKMNVGHFIYLMDNYDTIIPYSQMWKLLGLKSYGSLDYHLKKYKNGKYEDQKPDNKIEKKIPQHYKDMLAVKKEGEDKMGIPVKVISAEPIPLEVSAPIELLEEQQDTSFPSTAKEELEKQWDTAWQDAEKFSPAEFFDDTPKVDEPVIFKPSKEFYTTLEILPWIDEINYGYAVVDGVNEYVLTKDCGNIYINEHFAILNAHNLNLQWQLRTFEEIGIKETMDSIYEMDKIIIMEYNGKREHIDKNTPIQLDIAYKAKFYKF